MGSTYRAGEAGIQSLLTSGKFSDLQISCEGREFAVHKAIVCTQSGVMSAACEGGFEESITNVIKIEEFNADTVQMMLEYLYTGDYSVPDHTRTGTGGAKFEGQNNPQPMNPAHPGNTSAMAKKDVLSWHLSANAIGDYFGIRPLCVRAQIKVRSAVNEDWSPDDFLHLLTQACTTRRTGDVWFYRTLGEVMGDHLWHFHDMERLKFLDIPGVVLASVVASALKRLRPLHEAIKRYDLSAVDLDARLAEAASFYVHARVHRDQCQGDGQGKVCLYISDETKPQYTLLCLKCGKFENLQETPVS